MKLLLDTHVWLWLQREPDRVRTPVLEALRDPDNERLLSSASVLEIAIKYGTGKLPLPEPPNDYIPPRMRASATTSLAIDQHHALRVSRLPPLHRDPFDRLLVAQAQVENVPLVTVDRRLERYEVTVIRA